MPQLKALIFDLDGTLMDSAADLRQAINVLLKTYDRRILTLDEVKGLTGDGLSPLLKRAFAITGGPLKDVTDRKLFEEFIHHYSNVTPDIDQLYPETVTMLTAFRHQEIKIGLCTNKQEASTLRLMRDLDMARFFDFIAGGDTFPVHKPDPGHVLGVAENLGVLPENCIMIGDSANDVLAAHGAKIPCLVVTHGYSVDYQKIGGDGLVHHFKDLPKVIEKLGFQIVGGGITPSR